MGTLAVAVEMKHLLAFMHQVRDLPPEEQLNEIRRWIDETIRDGNDR
jgi:hypothetical protein